jgi:anaerobic selenocysteine-containing dehydrogenase
LESIEVSAAAEQGETLLPRPEPADTDAPLEPVAGAPEGADDPATPVGPRPPLMTFRGIDAGPAPHAADAYSLRLVATRSLYDGGTLVQHCPSLAQLSRSTRLRANPHDLSRLGVTTGDLVRVTSQRAGLILEAVSDAGVPRGSAAVDFNQPGEGAGDLIDAAEAVTDVRLETVTRERP